MKIALELPVKYLGNSHLPTPLPQADACGGSVGQDVPTNWLLGISLKPEMGEKLSSASHGVCIRKPPICKHEGICAILRHSGSRISCHLVGNKHSYVVL